MRAVFEKILEVGLLLLTTNTTVTAFDKKNLKKYFLTKNLCVRSGSRCKSVNVYVYLSSVSWVT